MCVAQCVWRSIWRRKWALITRTPWQVGVLWCIIMWGTGLRKAPRLTTKDWMSLAPIGLFAAAAHGGSVLALGAGAVSFAQIVKACEPVFAAVVALLVPPVETKPALAYLMLLVIVGGVGLACVKEGKGVEINYFAFGWASFANLAAALKGKLGKDKTHQLKAQKDKNMDSANVYAVHPLPLPQSPPYVPPPPSPLLLLLVPPPPPPPSPLPPPH